MYKFLIFILFRPLHYPHPCPKLVFSLLLLLRTRVRPGRRFDYDHKTQLSCPEILMRRKGSKDCDTHPNMISSRRRMVRKFAFSRAEESRVALLSVNQQQTLYSFSSSCFTVALVSTTVEAEPNPKINMFCYEKKDFSSRSLASLSPLLFSCCLKLFFLSPQAYQ
jgi:hypothetical protein